jgi:hypothetical protein
MPIIFNSVTQFEIQPERTKRRVKRDDLDTLSEVWVGPTVFEDAFTPSVGAAHPEANLMTVINTSIKRMPAGVSEVTINYQGKLDNSGTNGYTSVPTISESWMEGEVSFSDGGATYSLRYTGRCCEVSYITNRRPTGNPTNIGLSKEFLGFTNVWQVLTGLTPGGSSGTGAPIEQIACTDVKVEDKADSWYRVSETYQSRMFPGNYQGTNPGGIISMKTTLGFGPASTSAAVSGQTTGAANAAASYSGASLSSSTPGTAEYDTYLATSIDPAWGQGVTAEVNRAAAAYGQAPTIVPGVAVQSVSLSYSQPPPSGGNGGSVAVLEY